MTIRGGGNPTYCLVAIPYREWARRLGASPPKRMTASWSGPWGPTEYKVAARSLARRAGSPRFVVVFAVLGLTDGGSRMMPLRVPSQSCCAARLAGPSLRPQRPGCPKPDAVLGAVEAWPGNANPASPSSGGQPRQRLRAASSQLRRPGRRNSAQAEQRNRTKPNEIR
jgi:hypothetical protein